jgi:DUF1680 family protein
MTMLTSTPLAAVELTAGVFNRRRAVNREYLVSLRDQNLLQNHLAEAGLGSSVDWQLKPSSPDPRHRGLDRHWGWESPAGQLRGHFLGHWLSAAAREAAVTGDRVLEARVRDVVAELARCQRANGGEWVFGIPTVYLDRIAAGVQVWAPQYNVHKTLMGLVDVARDLGDREALDVAVAASRWFARWSATFTREQFDDILDIETGGMLEVWADLLELTGDDLFRELLDRYYRARLFDPLLEGVDMLTNMHANTTIPEILGAARAYEVTGDGRWADIVRAYWRWAVTERGEYATGGQTSGEIWTPPFEFSARRGDKNQEYCVVYNMIRLADVLFRWTGEVAYLDYIERNLFNGILAQQHPTTGMVAYFLPLEGGAAKLWGSPTEDFWCCHGTLVQSHTRHSSLIFYEAGSDIVIAQHIASTFATERDGMPVTVTLERRETVARMGPEANAAAAGARRRPQSWGTVLTVTSDAAVTLRVRIPSWVVGAPVITVDGVAMDSRAVDGFVELRHGGGISHYELTLPLAMRAAPIPDEPTTVAFLEGPILLAGLVDAEVALTGNSAHPEDLLVPDNERQWGQWLGGYRAIGQQKGVRFIPLHEVVDQRYSVYFPILN